MPSSHTPQPLQGKIVYWNDQKGFGFIQSKELTDNLFFHISTFAYHHRRPQHGDKVWFLMDTGQSKVCAKRVVLSEHFKSLYQVQAQDQQTRRPHFSEAIIYSLLILGFYVTLAFFSPPLLISSLVISFLTITLYYIDKFAAIHGRQRVPEASMHIATMLGGWPGALIIRPLLRHKTSKQRFIIFFWLSIVIYFFTLYCFLHFAPQLIGIEPKL